MTLSLLWATHNPPSSLKHIPLSPTFNIRDYISTCYLKETNILCITSFSCLIFQSPINTLLFNISWCIININPQIRYFLLLFKNGLILPFHVAIFFFQILPQIYLLQEAFSGLLPDWMPSVRLWSMSSMHLHAVSHQWIHTSSCSFPGYFLITLRRTTCYQKTQNI